MTTVTVPSLLWYGNQPRQINFPIKPSREAGWSQSRWGGTMRVSERMFFIPPSAGLETQSSQRENMFSFLVRGQKRKDLTA